MKKYYKFIDLIRVISCIGVLLYHMNILKGGYLAVCTFFVFAGYLSYLSASKGEFSIKSYYKKRLLHIYIPLLIVVFSSIGVVYLCGLDWLNLKPETRSVLFGYNNFWQLGANLDYFAHHVNSPFIHLWYIAILIQFDLIFPFVFKFIEYLKNKVDKSLSFVILLILLIISTGYFYLSSISNNIMYTYYNSFSRVFSLLFGLFIGYIHVNYKEITFKNSIINKLVFSVYLVIFILFLIFVDSSSTYFNISMILVTIISCRLIDYSVSINNDKLNIFDKVIKYISSISYEVYLVQYPVIFLFQNIDINNLLIILIIFIVSVILHFSTNFKNKNIFKYILLILIILFSIFGCYKYIITKDHTKEMKELEIQLEENTKEMELKQKEYEEKLKKEQENFDSMLKQIENDSEALKKTITNLPVVGVGDSVMLGAVNDIYNVFPNGYFDAKISRTAWVANDILKGMKTRGLLSDTVVFGLGANGDCPENCKNEILNTIGDSKLFWLNASNDNEVHVNANINKFADKHDNVYVIDWASISKGHPEYFVADKIHLTNVGRKVYAETIYNAIYDVYVEKYNKMRDELVKKHEDSLNSKMSFYGNDMLINAYEDIKKEFNDSSYVTDLFTFDTLKDRLKSDIDNKLVSNNIVFIFDSNVHFTKDELSELLKICDGYKLYLVLSDDVSSYLNEIVGINTDNIVIIDFNSEIIKNNYLMADKIHLTSEGNIALSNMLKNSIK